MDEGLKKIREEEKKFQESIQKVSNQLSNPQKNLDEQAEKMEKLILEKNKGEAEHKRQAFIQTKQNEEMIGLTRDNLSLSKKFFVLSIITLIITILLMAGIAFLENQQQKNREIDKFNSELENLNFELDSDLELINEVKTKTLKGIIFSGFIVENLKKSIANENIKNKTIKKKISVLYFDLLETQNMISIRNSPEFALIFTGDSKEYDKKFMGFGEEIIKSIDEKKMEEEINIIKEMLRPYIDCIKKEKNFDKC